MHVGCDLDVVLRALTKLSGALVCADAACYVVGGGEVLKQFCCMHSVLRQVWCVHFCTISWWLCCLWWPWCVPIYVPSSCCFGQLLVLCCVLGGVRLLHGHGYAPSCRPAVNPQASSCSGLHSSTCIAVCAVVAHNDSTTTLELTMLSVVGFSLRTAPRMCAGAHCSCWLAACGCTCTALPALLWEVPWLCPSSSHVF